jgi:threonine dehydrogenase-like Zn-dependent dehydrogenase
MWCISSGLYLRCHSSAWQSSVRGRWALWRFQPDLALVRGKSSRLMSTTSACRRCERWVLRLPLTWPDGTAEALRLAGRGFDVVIDASGSPPARQTAFDLCRPGGQVVLLGMAAQRSEVNFVTSIRKEHRVVMSFAYTPVDFRRSLNLLIAGEIDLTRWTSRMPLERGQEAFERMSHDPGVSLKMLLEVAAPAL